MNFDYKKFQAELPKEFLPILDELLISGYIPILVGGIVRDFLLTGKLGFDWDIELTHDSLAFEKGAWKDLGRSLSPFGKVSFLPYEVIRLQIHSHQFEFSPPRIEHYKDGTNHHSNFDAEFRFSLPFEESALRRDFTINAMGLKFKSRKDIEFLDPFFGLIHLRDKILHYAGPDFKQDPVRFLRAHRFANRFKFSFSPELKKILDHMNLEGITPSYLWSEMQKASDPINFMSFLVQEKNEALKIPLGKNFTDKLIELKKVMSDPKKHEVWIIALEWVDISSENWAKYFSLGVDHSKKLARWAKASRLFESILPESYHGEFEELRDTENFEKLFDWYYTTKHLLQKNPDLPLLKMIEDFIPDWIHLFKFEPLKDVKHIDPPYRAKYQLWNLCQRL
jgi:hypothetical protein